MDPAAPPSTAPALRGLGGELVLQPFQALRAVTDPRSSSPTASPVRVLARAPEDAMRRWATWRRKGRISADLDDALWVHEWTSNGMTVRGLVGTLDVTTPADDPHRAVLLPHEAISTSQTAELADRMQQLEVQPAPLLLVHHGTPLLRTLLDEVTGATPDQVFNDPMGQGHRLWALRTPELIDRAAAATRGGHAVIADGHHRFAAYVQMAGERPDRPGSRRGLVTLVDQDDTPLFLGAIHRLLHGVPLDTLRQAAEQTGHFVRRCSAPDTVHRLLPHTLVASDGADSLVVDAAPGLPVRHLHEAILPALRTPVPRISYHHSVEQALARTVPSQDIAVLLPAPTYDEVLHEVSQGRQLPVKATSFQPKPSVGVIMRSLADD